MEPVAGGCRETTVIEVALGGLLQQLAPGAALTVTAANGAGPGELIRVEYGDRWMGVLRGSDDVDAAKAALQAGASCLASLDDPLEQFRQAIASLIEGTPGQVPVALARLMLPNGRSTGHAHNEVRLTQREREVLHVLVRGCTNAELAAALGISVHTVRTHLSSMASKLHAHNRTQLVAKARELGYEERPGDAVRLRREREARLRERPFVKAPDRTNLEGGGLRRR